MSFRNQSLFFSQERSTASNSVEGKPATTASSTTGSNQPPIKTPYFTLSFLAVGLIIAAQDIYNGLEVTYDLQLYVPAWKISGAVLTAFIYPVLVYFFRKRVLMQSFTGLVGTLLTTVLMYPFYYILKPLISFLKTFVFYAPYDALTGSVKDLIINNGWLQLKQKFTPNLASQTSEVMVTDLLKKIDSFIKDKKFSDSYAPVVSDYLEALKIKATTIKEPLVEALSRGDTNLAQSLQANALRDCTHAFNDFTVKYLQALETAATPVEPSMVFKLWSSFEIMVKSVGHSILTHPLEYALSVGAVIGGGMLYKFLKGTTADVVTEQIKVNREQAEATAALSKKVLNAEADLINFQENVFLEHVKETQGILNLHKEATLEVHKKLDLALEHSTQQLHHVRAEMLGQVRGVEKTVGALQLGHQELAQHVNVTGKEVYQNLSTLTGATEKLVEQVNAHKSALTTLNRTVLEQGTELTSLKHTLVEISSKMVNLMGALDLHSTLWTDLAPVLSEGNRKSSPILQNFFEKHYNKSK